MLRRMCLRLVPPNLCRDILERRGQRGIARALPRRVGYDSLWAAQSLAIWRETGSATRTRDSNHLGNLAVNDALIAPVAGGVVFLFGLALLISHVRTWRAQREDPKLSETERRYYRLRFRRRMQASGILLLLGILIPLGDWLFALKRPVLSTVYWAGVLLLTGWVIVLGLGDFISTSAHSRAELSRIHQKQRELEEQLAQYRSRTSNGRK